MPNPSSDFLKFANTPFESWILPIIPAKATLKPREDGKPGIAPENLGKIPGKYVARAGAWVGFFNWQDHRTTKDDLKQWQGWQTPDVPIAIGMRTAEFPVVDIDSDAPEIVEAIHSLATKHLGWSPVRCREESPRRVLCYKWTPGPKRDRAPVRKMRFAFTDNADEIHVVEILGFGQQVVIEGPHAKGKMHYWLDQKGLTESHGELVDIGAAQASEFLAAVREWAEEQGFTPVKLSLPTSSDRAAAVKIDIMSPHVAGDMKLLARCVDAIDINDPRLADYDTWCALFRAIKAACGGDQAFYAEHVWPWLRENPENKEEEMEATWNSFHDSQLGADYVYGCAAQFGFTEGVGAIAERIFGAQPEPETGNTGEGAEDASESGGETSAGAAAVPGGAAGGGPTPFPFTDEALADTFADQHRDWRYAEDQGWVRIESGVYVRHPGVIHPISRMCSAIGNPYRAQGSQGAKIDQVLKSTRKASEVERLCRSHPSVFARSRDFDADPWLLNTPDFIIDLRDGSTLPHGMLMRQQTLVTPLYAASGFYEDKCPRWLAFLEFLADGRGDVVPFLRRWGAYSLVGVLLDQYFLFIHGVPGTGKSVFIKILCSLAHSYGIPVSKGFFVRSLDKRTFELFQTIGKRALFGDETMAGATWDEILFTTMLSGTEISAEGKGRDFARFNSFAKITISGNHKPAFVQNTEEAGVDRRLLLLSANKKIKDHMPDNTRFAAELLREEGAAILMWFVEEAAAGWRDLERTGSFMGGLEVSFMEAAKAYRRESNPFLQWVEEEMETGPDFDIESTEARRRFKAFMVDENPKYAITRRKFREGMEAAGFAYGKRMHQPGVGRLVHKGLREKKAQPDTTVFDNVVAFTPN